MNPEDARIALLSAPHSPPVSLLESCSHSSGALRVEYPRNNFWPLHKLMLRDLSHPRGDSVHLYVVRNGELHRETSVTVYDQADPEAQAEALLTSLDVQPGDTLYGVLFGRSHITNLPQSFWFNTTQITEPV